MIVISHRGYWKSIEEKNTAIAFHRSFDLGFGTETDIRDLNQKLVISHDMPDESAMLLSTFLDILGERDLPLALNIKADGLSEALKSILLKHGNQNWFVFDMAVPDMRSYINSNIPVFARLSEVEQPPVWFDQVAGIWLDSFEKEWYDTEVIQSLLKQNKKVCVVSSELHGREHNTLWNMLKPLSHHSNLMICTDLPEQAQQYFGVSR